MISKNNEIDILEIIQTIWINKKTIILITTLITILGIIYALILTPWYTANIKILPSSKSNNFINRYAGLAAMVGIDIQSESGNEQLIYPEIIKSNFILDRLLEHKFKTNKYKYPVSIFEFWDMEIDSTEYNWKNKLYEKAKTILKDNYISSTINNETNILVLTVNVPNDPLLAANMANFIIDQLDIYNKTYRKNKAKEQIDFIETSLDKANSELNNAQENLKLFKENNKIIDSSPAKQLEFEKLKTEAEVQKVIYIELKKQLEIAKIEEIKETETLNILEEASVPFKKTKPNRMQIIFLFFFIGLFISLVYIIFTNYIYDWITKN
jgi:uncharacterized protein involved in exopolysaccharide biosynthesis